ncbi:MAG TPA: phage tail protein [Pseudomonas sp.]|nr:phage tail protein [Pseudomonas sp.]
MGQSNKPITKGFRYFFGLHLGLCKALDELVEIRVGGRNAWKGSATGQARFQIDNANLFGGDDGEGGIYGSFDLMQGWADQPVNKRLAHMLGTAVPVPAFRGVATGFFDGLVTSMSQYPKPWEFRMRRSAAGWDGAVWYPEKVKVLLASNYIHAMNPAHIMYECITNRQWGRGKARSIIDDAQWRTTADRLHAEGFGLVIAWKRSDKISNFIRSVLDHIGASLVTDRRTGLLQLTLIRADYVADALVLFDEDSGLLEIEEDDNAASAVAANEITVTYTNMLDGGKPGQVRVKNVASIQSIGGVLPTAVDYKHLPTAELALRVAQRDLSTKLGLKRFKVRLDRRAYLIKPGDVFRIRSLARGIDNIVLRAGRVDDGRLDSGAITVTAIQDVFGMPATSFVAVAPPNWSPPLHEPIPAAVRRGFEVSYRDLVANLTPIDLARITPTSGALGMVARRPSYNALNYALITRVGSAAYVAASTGDWCPTAQIIDAIGPGPAATTIKLTHITDIAEGLVGQPALIDNEIVKLVSIDWATGTAVIGRGCLDTVPNGHAAGARIWFYATDTAVDPIEYTTGVTVNAKVLTHAPTGWLDPALAPVDNLTFNQRQHRPYPPGKFQLNSLAYPNEIYGDITITWAHRDRLLQADQVVDTLAANIGPEPGTTYTVRVRRVDTNAQLALQTGLTTTSLTLAIAYNGDIRVELWAVRDGLQSWDWFNHQVLLIASARVTESNEVRITEDGAVRVLED